MSPPRAAVILAAGQGVRMKSALPKVLHRVGGRPMADWAIALARACGCGRIVLVAAGGGEAVQAHARAALGESGLAIQDKPLGTAHAVRAAEDALSGHEGDLVVLYADTPLIRAETVEAMFAARSQGGDIVVLGFEATDPTGYGRLVRSASGDLERIVEEKDASDAERKIALANSGVMLADAKTLFSLLSAVKNENAKREYYLTDVVGLARGRGLRVGVVIGAEEEMLGVNARAELAQAEAAFQARARAQALAAGVTMIDPASVYFSYDTKLAPDVTIEPNVYFAPGCSVESGAVIHAFCHFDAAHIGPGAEVGPFARLRPGARLGAKSKVGNFVEMKNAHLGDGAKAPHLTYLGDADIGARANIGAGTITCNYDGFDKHRTTIGEGAFIGSDTALVAPVTIGPGAYTGSGSVITKDVPADALAVARGKQSVIEGWAARFRVRKGKDKT